MRYSIDHRGRIYVKGYGFLYFAKNMGKNLSIKSRQKLLESKRKSAIDALKLLQKEHSKERIEATEDLVGNETANKNEKSATQKTWSKSLTPTVPTQTDELSMKILKEKYIPPKKQL